MSLRVTQLRDGTGTVWYVRNGEVLTLGNVSQGFSTLTIDVPVPIDENPERVVALLREAVAEMHAEPDWEEILLEEPSVLGIGACPGRR
ncbi:hypothetical protein G7085_10140 [Tessaracoccus sp. HDW20]|uniref:hypothetical protein n=1 Tax=Tessaracoccus coleopterorum TaxID=2714950 RepID=UPI0018D33F41|nr:hypothetical protein [Tessaracoccus coleopterorum]